ncbi:hydrogenase maturation nickel metallochaperone HypA [Pelobacter propionicus]|uniref:Hydrogenase maturation factor HypA n=1 Tax=Pelobacter propionicus (strain DSM 2379 / NBRC 103807 / OttBd1) TaxID=338966 RepID=A1ASR1_PELPD|nr:hydrogenase maturation nickel metallochaperone HypA [Pelobacter propionicus]ABL00382.1 hydrogenase nickel insertion protein HypA [Pelobacter propionicus DSM 2379]
MHELTIMKNVVSICEQNAAGSRVTSVTLDVGELSGIVPGALEFCFDSCTKGTLLEGASLKIIIIEPQVRCNGCKALFGARAYHDSCPECGGFDIEILFGEELRVKELEVV